MPNVQGMIEKVYHNFKDKNGNLLSDDKINHKIKIEGEVYIIKGKYCPDFIKEGKKVSIAYNVWKPPHGNLDMFYVMKDKESNRLLINDLSIQQEKTSNQSISDEEISIDDNLSDYEPDHFASNGVVDNSGTNFDPNYLEKELTNPQTLKEQQIFCTAILKSSIEGKFLEPSKDNIDKMILMLKDIYKRNFIK